MEWTTSDLDAAHPTHLLWLEAGEPVEPALRLFWERILSDLIHWPKQGGCRYVAFQLTPRDAADHEGAGFLECLLWDSSHQQLASGRYELWSSGWAYPSSDAGEQREQAELAYLLDAYALVRDAAGHEPVRSLWRQLCARAPLTALAAAVHDWFDLAIGEQQPGPLSDADAALLLPQPDGRGFNPFDPELVALMHQLTDAVIGCLPSGWERGACIMQPEEGEAGMHINVYLESPDHPGFYPRPSEQVGHAVGALAGHWLRGSTVFPPLIAMFQRDQGVWRSHVELMDGRHRAA